MQEPSFNNPLGKPFIELPTIDSTNNYASHLVHEGLAQHGAAYFAHAQTRGKGQRGKNWIAEKGSNIILTIVLRPSKLDPARQFPLNACIALGAHKFFSHYAGEDSRIKWPNDIYWQDRKAGGILIENIIGIPESGKNNNGAWKWALAGIGININQTHFPPELRNPVSLKHITGENFDTVALAKELCETVDHFYRQLMAGQSDKILSEYRDVLYKKDQRVRLKKDNRVFEATIKTVTDTGRLVIHHGIEEELEYGDVEWLLAKN